MFEQLYKDTRAEFPYFLIIKKTDSAFMRFINFLLRLISFGRIDNFMTKYTTTIGTTMYVPEDWDKKHEIAKCTTLRHERVHMRQARKYGRPLFSFLYLFAFFPIGLAYFRAKFEKEAYAETILATAQMRTLAVANDPVFRESIIQQFVGPAYLYMWPFRRSMEKWYDAQVKRAAEVLDE